LFVCGKKSIAISKAFLISIVAVSVQQRVLFAAAQCNARAKIVYLRNNLAVISSLSIIRH